MNKVIIELEETYKALKECIPTIEKCIELIIECYEKGGKLLVAGNGGSASDCEHIVGELMKGFKKERHYESKSLPGERLQVGLPAISLVSQSALITAISNDNGGDLIFAQQVLGYGKKGDIFIGITTSGNSSNIIKAALIAKERGLTVIGMTGSKGGKLKETADYTISVPADETFKVQEYHLPVYHAICASVENYFFEK